MKRNYSGKPQQGFTLIELLVVLVILGLLASIAGPKVMNYLGGAKSDSAKLQVEEFGASLDLFKLETGRYPTSQEGLQALVQAPSGLTGWNGPYLKKKAVPKDPLGLRPADLVGLGFLFAVVGLVLSAFFIKVP